jgi:hypothetical protein
MKQVSTVLKPYFDLPSKPFSSHFSHLSGVGKQNLEIVSCPSAIFQEVVALKTWILYQAVCNL